MGVPELPDIDIEPDYDEDSMWVAKQYPISTPRRNDPSVYNAVAIADYEAADKEELSFWKGDVITVITEDPSGWWEGRVSQGLDQSMVGKSGWFPYSFVQKIDLGTVGGNASAAANADEKSNTMRSSVNAARQPVASDPDPLAKLGLWKWNWQKDMWELCDFNGVPLTSEFAVASDPFSEEYVCNVASRTQLQRAVPHAMLLWCCLCTGTGVSKRSACWR